VPGELDENIDAVVAVDELRQPRVTDTRDVTPVVPV
jgi:hypothetical protein